MGTTSSGCRSGILLFILFSAIAFLSLSAGSEILAQTPEPTASVSPAGSPAITSISLSIKPAATLPASPVADHTYADIQISIQVSGFSLVKKVGEANVPGEGHIIYYLAQPPTFPYQPAHSASATYSSGTTYTEFTWTQWDLNAAFGSYWILAAQLVNNDETPLDPPVYAEIVTNFPFPGQEAIAPALTMMSLTTLPPSSPLASPEPDTTYMDVKINTRISAFDRVPANSRQNNVPGQGHIVYYQWVDPIIIPGFYATLGGNYTYSTSASPFTFLNVTPGYVSYSVQLVNNDDSVLDFPVYATIKTNLQPGMATITPPSESTASPTAPAPAPPTGSPLAISLTARDLAFSTSHISVPAGARVIINFSNMESGIQHNFALYTDPTGTNPVFLGTPVTGPGNITYTFTAPTTPGTYFFRCDFHPVQMFGIFVVTP